MVEDADFIICSDGGADRGGTAAGACLVHDRLNKKKVNILVFLGRATNNEAEITAGLLGLSWIYCLEVKSPTVLWMSDSEYTLKSATGYIRNWQKNGWRTATKESVKNQGLWQTYLHLSTGIKIDPKHVRGHSGHVENEICDAAANWAKSSAVDILKTKGEGEIPKGVISDGSLSWILLDGREFLRTVREKDRLDEKDFTVLADKLRVYAAKTGGKESQRVVKKQTELELTNNDAVEKDINHRDQLQALVALLNAARVFAVSMQIPGKDTCKIAKVLSGLLNDLRS